MLGLDIGPSGVIFCVPAHRILGFHVVDERTSRQDLERMRELTSILGTDEVAPLSDDLFWWAPGRSVTNGVPPSVLDGLCSSNPVPFDTMDG
jgi:hypothetical protein